MNTAYEFNLNSKVKSHFEKILQSTETHSEQDIVRAVNSTLEKLENGNVEDYVTPHIEILKSMLDMLKDKEWNLQSEDRRYVLSAMQYFALDNDLISDDIPVIGLLDDCIVIDIVAEKIKNELEAYKEFKEAVLIYSRDDKFTVEDWKKTKRLELFSRMRNRRNKRVARAKTRGTSFSIA